MFAINPSEVVQTFLLTLCVTSLLMWVRALIRHRNCLLGLFPDLVPARPRQMPFWGIGDPLILFGLTLLLIIGAMQVMISLGLMARPPVEGQPPLDKATQVTNTFAQIGASLIGTSMAFFVSLILLSRQHPDAIGALGFKPTRSDLLLSIKAIVMILPPVLLLAGLLDQFVDYEHPVLSVLSNMNTPARVAVVFLSTVIAAPITEEYLYRGLLTGALERLGQLGRLGQPLSPSLRTAPASTDSVSPLGNSDNPFEPPVELTPVAEVDHGVEETGDTWSPSSWWPILASSLVFALMHFGHGAAPIALFFFAVALGYLYRRTGSLIAPIVVHIALNLISLTGETVRVHFSG